MARGRLNALLDSDVLLDFLDGFAPAGREIARYDHCSVSIISWMEILAGARSAMTMSYGVRS